MLALIFLLFPFFFSRKKIKEKEMRKNLNKNERKKGRKKERKEIKEIKYMFLKEEEN